MAQVAKGTRNSVPKSKPQNPPHIAPPAVEGPGLARTGGTSQLPLVAVLFGLGFAGVTLSRSARRRELLR